MALCCAQAAMPFGQWIAIQKESMQHADPASSAGRA